MSENILEINNLSKYFGGLAAVSDCYIKVKKGTITGIIGPNGSGKTTLFNLIAGNLSGGQKKLLELGRTMMVDAKLVLLDEVGAGVNRTLLKDLGTAIQKLNQEKGYTFCMIEHDMDFIGRLCDPVIVMAEGSVLLEGTVENAKKDQKVIESYLGRGSKLKDKN